MVAGSVHMHIHMYSIITLRPRQNGRRFRFADDTFKGIFLNENVRISIKISLKFVPKGPINNSPALVQIMAWRRSGGKPLSEPMMVCLLTHICVTRPQWVMPRACNHTPVLLNMISIFSHILSNYSDPSQTKAWPSHANHNTTLGILQYTGWSLHLKY